MDEQQPKPARKWPGFVKEVGIVVLGVCLALAAQQAVDEWREARSAREAREAIRAELVTDLSYLRLSRSASQPCVERRLEEIATYLAAAGRGETLTPPGWVGRPRISIVYSGQWQAATQSGRVSLLPREEAAAYANMYYVIESLQQTQMGEQDHWAELRTLQRLPKLSPEMVKQFQVALSHARYTSWRIRLSTQRLQEIGLTQDLKPDPGYRVPGERSRVDPVCIPMDTQTNKALAMVGTSFGEPN